MFNVENLAGKLTDCSFVSYVTSFNFACLRVKFADSTFNFNGLFTEHLKFVALAKDCLVKAEIPAEFCC